MKTWAIGLLLVAATVAAEEFPVRMAAEGRLFLTVDAGSPPLEEVGMPGGTVTPGNWLPEGQRERVSDVRFPLDWWRWRDLRLSFTPKADGEVELSLNGPWGEKSPGVLWRQEVLWDDFKATGTALGNGDFAHGLAGWDSPWREYPAKDEWPLRGQELGASWHGRPLVRKLRVQAGQRVEIRFRAQAAVPAGFREPRRLGRDTPAHRAWVKLKRGVNLGNCWDAPPGTWGLKFGVEDIDRIAASGFDHIRVPVTWNGRLGPDGIDPEFLGELEPLLRRALERKLTVILNWHHFDELNEDPGANRDFFLKGWRRIAEHFREWPPSLYLEILNEPRGALAGETLNALHAEAIAEIRKSNPTRILVVDPGGWASVRALGELRLPDDDDRIIVSIHCYDPFEFTHQGAGWVGLEELKGVVFPGPPTKPLAVPAGLGERAGWIDGYNRLEGAANPCSIRPAERLIGDAADWAIVFGRPVHLGEFGCFRTADAESRRRYATAVREAAERRRLPWCWWEWKAGFGCWDAEAEEALLIRELTGS